MANWDNRRWTYQQDLNGGTGIYVMKDDMLRTADGVKTVQSRLNSAGYYTGTPVGKFGYRDELIPTLCLMLVVKLFSSYNSSYSMNQ